MSYLLQCSKCLEQWSTQSWHSLNEGGCLLIAFQPGIVPNTSLPKTLKPTKIDHESLGVCTFFCREGPWLSSDSQRHESGIQERTSAPHAPQSLSLTQGPRADALPWLLNPGCQADSDMFRHLDSCIFLNDRLL